MQLSEIDLNLLLVLEAILETESVKGAAARLSLSPSATSHALSRLRDALDDPILVRAGKAMVPSARAARLRPRLRQALDGVRHALESEQQLDPARMRRQFRVAATDYAELLVVRALSEDLAASAPGVDLYSQALVTTGLDVLRSGSCDLIFGVRFDFPDDIAHEALFRDQFVCVLRKGHPALRRSRTLSLRRYVELPHVLITPRGTPHGVVDALLERAGTSRRVARTVSSFLVAPRLVRDSDMVLTLPSRVAHSVAADLGLEVRKPPIEVTGFAMRMAWHRRDDADPGHRWLRDRIRAVVADKGW